MQSGVPRSCLASGFSRISLASSTVSCLTGDSLDLAYALVKLKFASEFVDWGP